MSYKNSYSSFGSNVWEAIAEMLTIGYFFNTITQVHDFHCWLFCFPEK